MSVFFVLVSWALVAMQVGLIALNPSNAFMWACAAFTTGCAITTTFNR